MQRSSTIGQQKKAPKDDDQRSIAPERLKGETTIAYRAFMDFCRMGASRSIKRLADEYAKQPEPMANYASLRTFSSRNKWPERVAQFDKELAELETAQWVERRAAAREDDWQIGETLRQLAIAIIEQAPQFMRTRHRYIRGKRGEPDREISITSIDLGIALTAAKLASELQRLAAEMPNRFIDVQSAGKHPAPTLYLPVAFELVPIDAQPEAPQEK